MEFNSRNINELIVKYLEGGCPEEEKRAVLDWINTSKENKHYFFAIKRTWNLSALKEKPNPDNVWNNISKTIKHKEKFDLYFFYKVASFFIIAFGLGIATTFFYGQFGKKTSNLTYNETIVPYGATADIILSDGSSVKLNAGSKLKYPSVFNDTTREVFLEGEAFFEVETNKKKPFIVNTHDAVIKAYGTTFNVNAYKDEPVVTATLVEGIIAVKAKDMPHKEVTLKPNDCAIIQKSVGQVKISRKTEQPKTSAEKQDPSFAVISKSVQDIKLNVQSEVNTDLYTSWKENIWVIESESLESLSKKLERRFDIAIMFANKELKDLRFTGKIMDEPLEQVLQFMGLTAPLKHKIEGRNVEFYLDTSVKNYKTLYGK